VFTAAAETGLSSAMRGCTLLPPIASGHQADHQATGHRRKQHQRIVMLRPGRHELGAEPVHSVGLVRCNI
jgi:hypothetical protein